MPEFDFVVGNPPYQLETSSDEGKNNEKSRKSIFQLFQTEADLIAKSGSVLIYPGKRWIHRSGKGMKDFGIDQINDVHLASLDFYPTAQEIFPSAQITDGITIVTKNMKKMEPGFKYNYWRNGEVKSIVQDNPGEDMLILDPDDAEIMNKVHAGVVKNGFGILHYRVMPRSLFGIESDFVEKNPDKVELFQENKTYDFSKKAKLLTNDKSGSAGRTRLYVVDRDNIPKRQKYIDEWQVVAISANPGGQRRDNQLQVIDNHTAFGRAKVALGTFKTEEEAENFFAFCKSYLVRFALLMTDENLTSLALRVPDLGNYSDSNGIINYSKPIDQQLYQLFDLNESEINHIESIINEKDNKGNRNETN